jgi:hypothetical protein
MILSPALVSASTPCGSPYGVSWPPRLTCILAFRLSSFSFRTNFAWPVASNAFSLNTFLHSVGAVGDRKRMPNLGAFFLNVKQALLYGVVWDRDQLPSAVAERIHREAGSSWLVVLELLPTLYFFKNPSGARTMSSGWRAHRHRGIWVRIGRAITGR